MVCAMSHTSNPQTPPNQGLLSVLDSVAHRPEHAAARQALELAWNAMPDNSRAALKGDAAFIGTWLKAVAGTELKAVADTGLKAVVETGDRPSKLDWPFDEELAVLFISHHLTGFPKAVEEFLKAGGYQTSFAPSTLKRRLSSLATLHSMTGHANPLQLPAARVALRAAGQWRKSIDPKKAPALTGAMIASILEHTLAQANCDDQAIRLQALRDAALIAFAFSSGGRRRSECVAVFRENCSLIEPERGRKVMICRLSRSKTAAAGAEVVVTGVALDILLAWLEAAGIQKGPLFRPVNRHSGLGDKALSDRSVWTIVHRRAKEAGYDATAHSIRAGFMTEAGLRGMTLQQGMAMSLHASVQQALSYHRPGEIAAGPAAHLLDRFGIGTKPALLPGMVPGDIS